MSQHRKGRYETVMSAVRDHNARSKKLKEESTGDIRGLGNVTGNPMVGDDEVTRYREHNIDSADHYTDQLNKRLERWGLRALIDRSKSIQSKKAKGTVF